MKKRCVEISFLLTVLLIFVACSEKAGAKHAQHMERGDAYFQEQEYKKAIIEYKNAIQADPELARAHYQLALAYMKTSQQQQAVAELLKTVELEPEHIGAQIKLGQFLLAAKKTAEADKKAEIVLRQEPENIDALFLKIAVTGTYCHESEKTG
jgi:Tfp pilus assembly protein PilF